MIEHDFDELNQAERRALASLGADEPLPPGLEDRVVGELRRRGLVASSPGFGWVPLVKWTGIAAALVMSFLVGVRHGEQRSEPRESISSPHVIERRVPISPGENFATAFHMDLDQPLDKDSAVEDPQLLLAKTTGL